MSIISKLERKTATLLLINNFCHSNMLKVVN